MSLLHPLDIARWLARRRGLAAALVAVALALSCASQDASAAAVGQDASAAALPGRAAVAGAPPLTGTPKAAVRAIGPSRADGAWVAKLLVGVVARARPGGAAIAYVRPVTTYTRSGTRLLVTAARYDERGELWLEVALPVRPTGVRGWIPARMATLSRTSWMVAVSTSRRELRVYHGGRLRLRARVVVGAAQTPTPHGLFAIYEVAKQANPQGFAGPWALHLTALSRVLRRFEAGNGRVAIHGRGPAALVDPLGSARSNGCIRVDNAIIAWLRARLRPGTPVLITR